jgi:MOSC domain-containing protein YiiM
VRESSLPKPPLALETGSLLACVATVLELAVSELPVPAPGEDAAGGFTLSRWLGGKGLGLVPIAAPAAFAWPGPWLARITPDGDSPRWVVMFGVPSGVVHDPAGDRFGELPPRWIDAGALIAATDVAQAPPPTPGPPAGTGTLVSIHLAPAAAEAAVPVARARALPGRGLEGDRHAEGRGTFPSGLPGSALTLIEAEVCESFDPPLAADEHRRNLVTRGVALNSLVGREFTVGAVRCRGMRLCEPCTVVQRYAGRPVLRALVHRGGLRADILEEGEIAPGDRLRPLPDR